MEKRKTEGRQFPQIFHFDENKIEKICASLEDGMF